LLKEIEKQHGANQNITDVPTVKFIPEKKAAEEAGLSERQQVTAIRVASVSEAEFEAQVESDSPPTVTALAGRHAWKVRNTGSLYVLHPQVVDS
jgi:hypothetical protein